MLYDSFYLSMIKDLKIMLYEYNAHLFFKVHDIVEQRRLLRIIYLRLFWNIWKNSII